MLAIGKLEQVKRLDGGVVIARCPACATAGRDQDGTHLKVWPDGRFACVVFPGRDGREHRKEIWAKAGDGSKRPAVKLVYSVKVKG